MTCKRSVRNWESFGKSTTNSPVLPRAGKKEQKPLHLHCTNRSLEKNRATPTPHTSESFSVSPSAPTHERQRAGGAPSQDATLHLCRQNSRSIPAEHAKATVPSLGSPMGFPLLLTVVGWDFLFFPFFGGFLLPVFPRRATSPQGSTPGARSHWGPLPQQITAMVLLRLLLGAPH